MKTAYPYSEMHHAPRIVDDPRHLVILGSCLPTSNDQGLCIIQSQEACKVRELATHSSSVLMALPVLSTLAKAMSERLGPDETLHPYFHAIAKNMREAANLLAEAAALDNPDRREELYRQHPIN